MLFQPRRMKVVADTIPGYFDYFRVIERACERASYGRSPQDVRSVVDGEPDDLSQGCVAMSMVAFDEALCLGAADLFEAQAPVEREYPSVAGNDCADGEAGFRIQELSPGRAREALKVFVVISGRLFAAEVELELAIVGPAFEDGELFRGAAVGA